MVDSIQIAAWKLSPNAFELIAALLTRSLHWRTDNPMSHDLFKTAPDVLFERKIQCISFWAELSDLPFRNFLQKVGYCKPTSGSTFGYFWRLPEIQFLGTLLFPYTMKTLKSWLTLCEHLLTCELFSNKSFAYRFASLSGTVHLQLNFYASVTLKKMWWSFEQKESRGLSLQQCKNNKNFTIR